MTIHKITLNLTKQTIRKKNKTIEKKETSCSRPSRSCSTNERQAIHGLIMLRSRLVYKSFNVHSQWDNAIWNWIPYKLFIVRNNLILGQLATPFLVRFGIDLRSLQNLAFGLHHGRSLNIEAKHVEVFLNNTSMAQRANRVDLPENHVLVSFPLSLIPSCFWHISWIFHLHSNT